MTIKKLIIVLGVVFMAAPTFAKKAPELKWGILAQYDLKKKTLSADLKKALKNKATVAGFMIPLDYSQKEIKEFLLVPYYPACAHVPPPPANQTIAVKMKGKSKEKPSYYPVKEIGKIKVAKEKKKKQKKQNKQGMGDDPFFLDGVYTMEAESIEEMKF